MKVELKHLRFANSNDVIFNTDVASLNAVQHHLLKCIYSLRRQGEKQNIKKYKNFVKKI